MKLKTIILSLAIALGTLCAPAQNLDMLTREQARELVDILCRQASTIPESDMENVTGLSGISVIARAIDDSTVEMKYTLPDYVGDNSPEFKAFTMILMSGGGTMMTPLQVQTFTGVFRKAGYNIRATYTNGADQSCSVDLTPDLLEKFWSGDLKGAGIDPGLARKGLLKSFNTDEINSLSQFGIGTLDVRLDGRWVSLNLILGDISGLNALPKEEIRKMLLEEYASAPVISKMSGAMVNASDFIGLDGLKISYEDKTESSEPIYLSWSELMNNR